LGTNTWGFQNKYTRSRDTQRCTPYSGQAGGFGGGVAVQVKCVPTKPHKHVSRSLGPTLTVLSGVRGGIQCHLADGRGAYGGGGAGGRLRARMERA
jgi:hypothetical protein